MSPSRNLDDGAWHLDKKIPVALIVSILLGAAVHTSALVWWGSNITTRIEVLEKGALAAAPQADRLTRVEVKVETIQSSIDRLEQFVRSRLDNTHR